ncbi:MAG TPA: Glu/Leu/Phe/Val dehydrogenase [Candidatus Limnocylindrales bacterium]|nr:Glu/Leu/Phe/Val dehydrogenase [Candidatus Limnocylindrales bacterium]
MKLFCNFKEDPYEQVVFFCDPQTNLKAIVAIHNTKLGPALGGTRMWAYETEEEALRDVLRLSKAMTYKASVAGLDLGGGKAVIIGDPCRDKTDNLLKMYGRYLERLGGYYITAPDVGTNQQDMDVIATETDYVAGTAGGSGDPAPFTAYGTWMGMKAAVKEVYGKDSLNGLTVAVQGLGSVGYFLCRYLHDDGAHLVVTDLNYAAVDRVSQEFKAESVGVEEIYAVRCDIFAPSALGAVINARTIPQLKCAIIAGPANNILENDRDGDVLQQKGICYVPDYVINAGGLINVADQFCGYNKERVMKKAGNIYNTVLEVLTIAKNENMPTYMAADMLAVERIRKAPQNGWSSKR